jgi:hypothetical protein
MNRKPVSPGSFFSGLVLRLGAGYRQAGGDKIRKRKVRQERKEFKNWVVNVQKVFWVWINHITAPFNTRICGECRRTQGTVSGQARA